MKLDPVIPMVLVWLHPHANNLIVLILYLVRQCVVVDLPIKLLTHLGPSYDVVGFLLSLHHGQLYIRARLNLSGRVLPRFRQYPGVGGGVFQSGGTVQAFCCLQKKSSYSIFHSLSCCLCVLFRVRITSLCSFFFAFIFCNFKLFIFNFSFFRLNNQK